MPLPPVSTPFGYLITQIQNDLSHAAQLCREIRRNRHVGHEHGQLDALEASLLDGPSYIQQAHRKVLDIQGADVDGGDDAVRIVFTSYVREVEEINSRLESIAHPPTHHHGSHHHHTSLFFPSWDPRYHRDREVPHFHEIRLKWENVRDGIGHTFAQFIYRLELEAEKKKKEKEQKDKVDKDKKEAEEKAKEELKKAKKKAEDELNEEKEKAKKIADELKRKLEERERQDAERLALKEQHEQAKLRHVEEIAETRDTHVEQLLKAKIEENPIDQVRRVAGVVNELQQSITPRHHHEDDPIDQVRRFAGLMNEFNQYNNPRRTQDVDAFEQIRRTAGFIKDLQHSITPKHSHENIRVSASAYGAGGRATSLDSHEPIVICNGFHHERHPVIYHSRGSHAPQEYWSPRSSYASSHHTSHSSHYESPHHEREVVINNVIESVPPGDIEDISIDGDGHVAAYTGPANEYVYEHGNHYRRPRRVQIEAPVRRART
ncbi:hypothetical protein EG329_000296 [Mollisiaceae sp. DMI_Dod_QoI]|nr:hypothetical protein EG329_000296 [Helotiales sp. DMI_Dod_QoI]